MATRELTIQEKLVGFVNRWSDYHSTEMAGSQSYLRHLLECYGADDYEPGEIFEAHPVRVVQPQQTGLFGATQTVTSAERMDMYIPRICVWEMKGPDKNLADYYDQLLRYWVQTRTRYMVLCNFHEIWIYDTDEPQGLVEPHKYELKDLAANHEALLFLRGDDAYFPQASEKVTREAARYVGQAVRELIEASDDRVRDRERITKFALECVFAMFAEDTGLIPGKLFETAMKAAQQSGDLAPVYTLFDDFGRENEYDRSNVTAPYINGPLFDRAHPKLQVNKSILDVIYTASQYDWTAVRPEVFGSIFEQALDPALRHELGAHFTAEADIMKVVGPTVVRPWRERIKACKTHKDCEALIEKMKHYHVLDPACGSGNFLYVVLREMKRLERALMDRWEERYNTKYGKRASDRRTAPAGPYFTVDQLHGIDKEEVAVQLTRVVLWIGQHLASRESDTEEATLPLTNLSGNIIKADALFTDWFRPEDDGVSELAIVGNPPFMGRHKMRQEMGDEYVDSLHEAFPDYRNADLVTYWYKQALVVLREGEQAGFVSTNSIGQNENREVSTERIVEAGGVIIEAWKSYVWPGEAAVHVSIVVWKMGCYSGRLFLNGEHVELITPRLTSDIDLTLVKVLQGNKNLSFKGVEPGNIEFVIDDVEFASLLLADSDNTQVVKQLLIGRDVNRSIDQSPTRWIIDFEGMTKEEARKFKKCFAYIEEFVYPKRVSEFDRKLEAHKAKWWQFHRFRPAMRSAIASLSKYIVTARTAPFCLFSAVDSSILADNATVVIALDTHYHYGILQSAVHEYWAWARGSTLKGDLRYTNTTIFETFPFPLLDSRDPFAGTGGDAAAINVADGKDVGARHVSPVEPIKTNTAGDACVAPTLNPGELQAKYDPRQVPDTPEAERVSRVAEELYTKRQAACLALNLGLTKLYNYIKGKTPLSALAAEHQTLITELQRLHEELNNAVCACYGWPEDTWRDENEVLKCLLELNLVLTSEEGMLG